MMSSRSVFRRPDVAKPYAQSICGAKKYSEEWRPFAEEFLPDFMKRRVVQFKPSKVGKLLTGPKNTGKTYLNNTVLADIPHLNVNFRGRVACTEDIIKEMDKAIEGIKATTWHNSIRDAAKKRRTGSSVGLGVFHAVTGVLGADAIPEFVESYLNHFWYVADAICSATDKVKDPIDRWETIIKKQADYCEQNDYTVQPMYICLEELNSALPHPGMREDMPKEYRERMDFFNRLMEMLVRVTKEQGLTQVIISTSDHAFHQIVKAHWGGGHAEIYCLGYMDQPATMDFLTHEDVVDEKTRDLIWQTCGGSFPHLQDAVTFVQQGHDFDALASKLEGAMAQAVGFTEGKIRQAKLEPDVAQKIFSTIAKNGFINRKEVSDEIFGKLIEANAVSFRMPCDIKEFALDLPLEARRIESITAFNPREHEALRQIFGVKH